MIKNLPWDSDHFGFPINSISVKDLIICGADVMKAKLNEDKIKLTYIFNDLNLTRNLNQKLVNVQLEKMGATYMDTKVVFSKAIENSNHEISEVDLYEDNVNSRLKLYQLAIVSGRYSRYKTDPRFTKEQFYGMYHAWVDNSINGKIANKIYVYKDLTNIIGFVTIKLINGSMGEIGLIAVNPEFQGKSIGTKLISKCEEYCNDNSIELIMVATQKKNIEAIKFYKKLGFEVENQIDIYHLWN